MKNWLKAFRIPKTVLGMIVLLIGFYLKNDTLIDIGWSILGLGFLSKSIKAAQGNDPWSHEKHILGIPTKKELQNG